MNFQLRFCHEPPAGQEYHPGMNLTETIHFKPLELEKESPEFVEKLGFLQNPFSFDRKQLALLVKTLNEAMNETEDEGEEDEEEDEED